MYILTLDAIVVNTFGLEEFMYILTLDAVVVNIFGLDEFMYILTLDAVVVNIYFQALRGNSLLLLNHLKRIEDLSLSSLITISCVQLAL